MGSASAPVTGGRVNPNNLGGSAKSVFWASAGVALLLFVIGVGVMMYRFVAGFLPSRVPRVSAPGVNGRSSVPSGLERYS
jgi:hypothetical protein